MSSVGVFLDLFTTNIMTREVGIEIEGNILARWSIPLGKWAILLEAFIILGSSFLDFQGQLDSLIFFSPVWGIARGLAGLHNLNVIVTYRALGIERYRKQLEWKSTHKTVKYRIGSKLFPASVLALCLYSYLLAQDVFARSVLFGLVAYFFAEILHT